MEATALRVLLVDESPFDAEMNVRVLENAGFRITRDLVSSSEQLISLLKENRFDLVISDYSFRGWTGLDALRLLREQCPAIPLIFVAARMADKLALECVKQGAVDCLRKGHLDRLPDAVRNALRRAEQQSGSSELAIRLASEKASLESAFEGITDPIILFDEQCRVQRLNKAATQLLGLEVPDILGRPCYEVLHGLKAPPEFCPHHRMLASGHPETGEFNLTGKEKSFDLTISPCDPSTNHFRGCVGVLRDTAGRHLAESVARQASSALAERTDTLNQREVDIASLAEMDDMLQFCMDAAHAHDLMAHFAGRFFVEFSGTLRVLRPDTGRMEAVAVWGDTPPSANSFSITACHALRVGGLSDTLTSGPACPHTGLTPSSNSLCVLISSQDEVLGMLEFMIPAHLGNGIPSNLGIAAIRRRATTLAEHLGRSLTNLRIREELRSQSIRDQLTGLFNRRYLEEALAREVHRAARAHRPLALIMMDVDHFKAFNDNHGHAAGDALLRALGGLLRTRIRGEDIACRYGGEEFLLILPEASLDAASKRAEQLREEALHLRVLEGNHKLDRITLSMGVAEYPKHGSSMRELLASADNSLYLAKQQGRDRVVVGVGHKEHA